MRISGCIRKTISAVISFTLCLSALTVTASAADETELPKGWLLWHSYTEYSALDSQLYLRSPDGSVETISGDFNHAMNGSFGTSPDQIIFMAMDKYTDEWDIYIRENGVITNLTAHSECRNEDPKLSPDGRYLAYKRGFWNYSMNDFMYDLVIRDLETGEENLLTMTADEEAMPCFSADGKRIYYANFEKGIGSIFCFDLEANEIYIIYRGYTISAYYPVVSGDRLYYTRWYSEENRSDKIICHDSRGDNPLPFNSPDYDCSDACPVDGDKLVFSSTMNGDYDLYYYDGRNVSPLSELNSDKNELGACFYSYDRYLENSMTKGDINGDGELNVADLVLMQKWLLAVPDTELKRPDGADLDSDGIIDAFDLVRLRRELLRCSGEGST
ncbi:dockerin type I domain-containing protein [uncultured Ruminococcus sp.]|uniref:dockerin type I domain-containing protein n=1 Tax=uncultured Ruminococcus sp. TaxID=165186 RepID=UPI0026210D59|nr:dockerin type I domain-containing protein [uncultured Ruminococcus sp.]